MMAPALSMLVGSSTPAPAPPPYPCEASLPFDHSKIAIGQSNASELRDYASRSRRCPLGGCDALIERAAAVVLDDELREQLCALPQDASYFWSGPAGQGRAAPRANGGGEAAEWSGVGKDGTARTLRKVLVAEAGGREGEGDAARHSRRAADNSEAGRRAVLSERFVEIIH